MNQETTAVPRRVDLRAVLDETGPLAVQELVDYLTSPVAMKRGYFLRGSATSHQLRGKLEKLVREDAAFVKFKCSSGYRVRYGRSSFRVDPREPRYLGVGGKLSLCPKCASWVFQCGSQVAHARTGLCENERRTNLRFVKLENAQRWFVVSSAFLYGVLDLREQTVRLPGPNSKGKRGASTEYWAISQLLRERRFIQDDGLLKVRPRETLLNRS
ncbi:MAG: hypothetical protein Kow0069_25260 [Promethearchaeota archaeon]